jgi:hypothetical protein
MLTCWNKGAANGIRKNPSVRTVFCRLVTCRRIIRKLSGGTAFRAIGPGWTDQEQPLVPEEYNAFVVAIFFLLLIGSWLFVNALIDLAAKRFRTWVSARWHSDANS